MNMTQHCYAGDLSMFHLCICFPNVRITLALLIILAYCCWHLAQLCQSSYMRLLAGLLYKHIHVKPC